MAGRHREAIPLLETARDAEPDNAMIWTNLGAAYLGNPIVATPEQQMQATLPLKRRYNWIPLHPTSITIRSDLCGPRGKRACHCGLSPGQTGQPL